MGKWILPWFGGGPAVWTTCLLFFQVILLAGYGYAHFLRRRLGERGQMLVHAAVVVAAVLLLPIGPSVGWRPDGAGDPTWRVLAVLAMGVGLPYFVLSATSPLVQAWFSVARPGASPYRLYALSNAGSLLALASYPFLIEPALRLRTQAAIWSAGFAAFAVLCVYCAVRAWRRAAAAGAGGAEADGVVAGTLQGRPGVATRLLWLALPACASVLLLAVTNQMCADVGVLPFLWVVPLGLYLVSFILCFESDRFYRRPVFWPLLVLALPAVLWLLDQDVETALVWQVLGYGAAFFVCCMVCHGELARLKPGPRHLTSFYLTVSAGGAAGGVFVALVAPLVFERYFELHIGLWACYALAMLALWRERAPLRSRRKPYVALAGLAGVAVLAGAAVALYYDADRQVTGVVASARNFYGVLQVVPYTSATDGDVYYCLNHGNVLHGCQYTSEPLRSEPTTYYGRQSGIGLALASRGGEGPVRVGIVGLGTGTIAAYGREGDVFRFYEINPDVMRFATTHFTYLGDSKAECEVVLGDARLSLEREAAEGYDVLALDAFSGDAIPLHLLTVEAFEIYRRHLKPDGILAAHISNRFLDLKPVVLGLADHFGMAVAVIDAGDEDKEELSPSLWVLLSADRASLQDDAIRTAASPVDASPSALRLWTDDYSDLFSVLVTK
ncbi:MAG: fused MFS/spermidine synthase [Planctomycetes bacterium]|nr:fused MFS/spermidine synthase [Planctomycetota bacterium]